MQYLRAGGADGTIFFIRTETAVSAQAYTPAGYVCTPAAAVPRSLSWRADSTAILTGTYLKSGRYIALYFLHVPHVKLTHIYMSGCAMCVCYSCIFVCNGDNIHCNCGAQSSSDYTRLSLCS
jgi:hypothetical protein